MPGQPETFNEQTWQEKIKQRLQSWKRPASYSLYGFLGAMSLWPLVEAMQQGQVLPVALALGSVAGNVGANLLANQVQSWADSGSVQIEDVMAWLERHARDDDMLRAQLDAVLVQMQVMQMAEAGLGEEDRAWFVQTLREELQGLGNWGKYEAVLVGSGAQALGQGAKAGGEKAVVGDDISGAVATGDGARAVKADTYIETQWFGADLQDQSGKAIEHYLTRLHQRCNVAPLAAMGGEESTTDEVTLDRVYVALDTTVRVPLKEEEKKGRELWFRDERPLSALEAVTQSRRVVILGDPGSGKSTFVKQLAASMARSYLRDEAAFEGWEVGVFPLLTVLRDLAQQLGEVGLEGKSDAEIDRLLMECIWRQWEEDIRHELRQEKWWRSLKGHLLERLTQGDAVLIFDGLDEVAPDLRPRVRRALMALRHQYPRVQRIIVTCRIRSYVGNVRLPGFDAFILAPFNKGKIRQLVSAWYRAQVDLGRITVDRATYRIKDLQKAALDPDLREMSSNPLLLTTMAIVHQSDVGLPKERVRLYSRAIDVLLRRWQKHKGLRVSDELEAFLEDDRKLRMTLERIANDLHAAQAREKDTVARLGRGNLLTLLEEPTFLGRVALAEEFLNYVDQRAGILAGYGGDEAEGRPYEYDFVHRAFQEYLAGSFMVGLRGRAREYRKRAKEGDAWDLAARLGAEELFFNRRGQHELLDLAYALCPAASPTTEAEWRALLWSGQMAALVGVDELRRDAWEEDGDPGYLDRLKPRLERLISENYLLPLERAEAANTLAHLGDPRPGVGLDDQNLPDILWSQVIAPGPFIMGNTKKTDPMAYDDEAPQFECSLITEPYRISVYPITVAQYRTFIEDGGYDEQRYWTEAGWQWKERKGVTGPADYGEPFILANHPQVGVSWYEAAAFCNWLSQQTGQTIQLPSEVQWERAARHTDGRRYPWSEEKLAEPDPNRMNYIETGIGATSAVGVFPAGQAVCGAQDMSGNVWEWCRTQWRGDYENYEAQVDDAPEGDYPRVLRGGSFLGGVNSVRCASRNFDGDPRLRYYGLGFRVVVAPPIPLNSEPSGL